jgi:hypothetical protein
MNVTPTDLKTANHMVTDLEADMPKVFAKIGRSHTSLHTEKFLKFIYKHSPVLYQDAYKYIHNEFPLLRDFESMLHGAISAGLIRMDHNPKGCFLVRCI